MFGFMRRKTDFFTMKDQANVIVNKALEKHAKSFAEDKVRQEMIERKKKEERQKRENEEADKIIKTKILGGAEADDSRIVEVTDEEAREIELAEAAKKNGTVVEEVKKTEDGDAEEDGKDKGAKPNSANGGSTDKYTWEQTLGDVTVNVQIPKGTTAKMLDVVLTQKKLSVKIKKGATIVEGEWSKPIKVDDSLWSIETDSDSNKFLQLNLTKKEG
jgi:hypothetical protein